MDVYVGSTQQQHWWLTYDNVGRLTFIDSGSTKDYVQRHFTYDARNRLASYLDVHTYADSVDYSGNRTDGSASLSNDRLPSMTGADGRAYTFTYNDDGRLTAKTASGELSGARWTPSPADSTAFPLSGAVSRAGR